MSNQDYSNMHSMAPWSKEPQSNSINSIEAKTIHALQDIGWKTPNQIEDIQEELSQAKATMIVNYGNNGKCKSELINTNDTLIKMIIDVCTWYENELKK